MTKLNSPRPLVSETRLLEDSTAADPGNALVESIELAVLERLPKEFKASHIGAVSAVKHKRSSERFAAISRWIDAKMVKRKSRGIYERVNKKKSK